MTELQCAEGPRNRWRIGPYEFQRYAREPQGRGRWGCCAHGRGVANCRSPLGAFFALRRWMQVPARPVEE